MNLITLGGIPDNNLFSIFNQNSKAVLRNVYSQFFIKVHVFPNLKINIQRLNNSNFGM